MNNIIYTNQDLDLFPKTKVLGFIPFHLVFKGLASYTKLNSNQMAFEVDDRVNKTTLKKMFNDLFLGKLMSTKVNILIREKKKIALISYNRVLDDKADVSKSDTEQFIV